MGPGTPEPRDTPKSMLIKPDDLKKAWKEVYRNKPRSKRKFSRGIDNVSIEDFSKHADRYLDEIYRQIQGGFFEFLPLKEYTIPRKGKKDRQIQAPSVRDRVVQKVLSDILMDKFKDQFIASGIVGSVRGTTIKKVIDAVSKHADQGYTTILKTDIQNYFPSIQKYKLKEIFYKEVKSSELRFFFDKYLNQSKLSGVPQGTPLSPFMANLYLMKTDQYLTKDEDIVHFRYIDDLIILSKDPNSVRNLFSKISDQFMTMGLSVHPLPTKGKTEIDELRNGKVDVLGVIFKGDKLLIKKSKLQEIERFIASLQFKQALYGLTGTSTNYQIKRSIKDLIKDVNPKIRGIAAAYKFCDVSLLYKKLDESVAKNLNKLMYKFDLNESERQKILSSVSKFSDAIR